MVKFNPLEIIPYIYYRFSFESSAVDRGGDPGGMGSKQEREQTRPLPQFFAFACEHPLLSLTIFRISAFLTFPCRIVDYSPPLETGDRDPPTIICYSMVITYSKGKNQPAKVANPARGQRNKEKEIPCRRRSHLRIWSRETDSAVPSRPSPY